MAIKVDAKAIREFSNEMTSLISFISDRQHELPDRVAYLGKTWQDDQFTKFKSESGKASKKLTEYLDLLKKIQSQITHDAEAADKYESAGGQL